MLCRGEEVRKKKPGELFDMYAEKVTENMKSQKADWMDYTIENFLLEEGEDYIYSATKDAARDYENSDIPMDADEFQYASLINFRELSNFIEFDVLSAKSDFALKWAELDPKDRKGKDTLIFETYARGQIEGGVREDVAGCMKDVYPWPDAEDIARSKKDGTYAQLRGRFVASVKSDGGYKSDDNDKGGK